MRSPAGIVLLVVIGIAVLGGIAVGIVFIVKSAGSGAEELARVWEEYEDIAEEAEEAQAKIAMDPTALNKAKEELEAARKKAEALEGVLAGTGVSKQDRKYVQLDQTIEVYEKYAAAAGKLYATLAEAVANKTLEANKAGIDAQIKEIKDLLTELGDHMEDYLADNEAVKTTPKFSTKVALDAIGDLLTGVDKATAAEIETRRAEAEARPYREAAGFYMGADGSSITLHADKTVDAIHADGGNSTGTYTLNGNTIIFVSEGITDVGTIENGVITAPDGRRWVRRQ